jgi:hypothetical protein
MDSHCGHWPGKKVVSGSCISKLAYLSVCRRWRGTHSCYWVTTFSLRHQDQNPTCDNNPRCAFQAEMLSVNDCKRRSYLCQRDNYSPCAWPTLMFLIIPMLCLVWFLWPYQHVSSKSKDYTASHAAACSVKRQEVRLIPPPSWSLLMAGGRAGRRRRIALCCDKLTNRGWLTLCVLKYLFKTKKFTIEDKA